jgi:hypothetical protein
MPKPQKKNSKKQTTEKQVMEGKFGLQSFAAPPKPQKPDSRPKEKK